MSPGVFPESNRSGKNINGILSRRGDGNRFTRWDIFGQPYNFCILSISGSYQAGTFVVLTASSIQRLHGEVLGLDFLIRPHQAPQGEFCGWKTQSS